MKLATRLGKELRSHREMRVDAPAEPPAPVLLGGVHRRLPAQRLQVPIADDPTNDGLPLARQEVLLSEVTLAPPGQLCAAERLGHSDLPHLWVQGIERLFQTGSIASG